MILHRRLTRSTGRPAQDETISAEVPLPTGCDTTSDPAPPLGARDEERSADAPLPSRRHAGFDFAPPFGARYEERSGEAPFFDQARR